MWQFKLFFHLYWRLHTLHDHGFSSSALNIISFDEFNDSRFNALLLFTLFWAFAAVALLLIPLLSLVLLLPPFCVVLLLVEPLLLVLLLLLRDDIVDTMADLLAADRTVLVRWCAPPTVLVNNANWPRRAPADFNAVNIFCCCTDRLFTCELFNCHDCILCRDTFIRLFDVVVAFWADDNDGNIIIGDGLRSILINFNPLKCSTAHLTFR